MKKNIQFNAEEISLMLVGVRGGDICKENSKGRARALEEDPWGGVNQEILIFGI